jgi:hypothetical protein
LSYRSQSNFLTSDHRPVSAVFHVRFQSGNEVKTGENEFGKVLARGYHVDQTKSEVCILQ